MSTGLIDSAIAAAVVALCTVGVGAQGQTKLPFDKATVSAEAAKKTLNKAQISADVAAAIADACVEASKAATPAQSTSIFILSPTGEIVHAHIMDGVQPIAIEVALWKAQTALYARTTSNAVGQRFATADQRLPRLNLGKSQGLAYYYASGGLPIVVDNQMIGAIGVGGGVGPNYDENCAYQAMIKVLGPQPPLPTAAAPPAAPAAAR